MRKYINIVENAGHGSFVAYHGSDEKFDAFDPAKTRFSADLGAIFFTDYKGVADAYGRYIYEVKLSPKNPTHMTSEKGDGLSPITHYDDNAGQYAKMASDNGHDCLIIGDGEETLYVVFDPSIIEIINVSG